MAIKGWDRGLKRPGLPPVPSLHPLIQPPTRRGRGSGSCVRARREAKARKDPNRLWTGLSAYREIRLLPIGEVVCDPRHLGGPETIQLPRLVHPCEQA